MIISGNYETMEKEITIVKKLLDKANIDYESVIKSQNENDSDVIVHLSNCDVSISIEFKEEAFYRFSKYHDLGIDYLSAFTFKSGISSSVWKGSPKSWELISFFEQCINVLKPGKIEYSNADAWLFVCLDDSGEIYYEGWFSGQDMTSVRFKNYLRNNCKFAVNNKPSWQLSHQDYHQSAVFFINVKDEILVGMQKHIFEIFDINGRREG